MAKNRPLRSVCYRLGRIDEIIADIIKTRGTADVLEVGCGFGLPMLELQKIFGSRVRLTGINRHEKFNLPNRALWEGVRKRCFWPWEPLTYEDRYGFPTYVNCDASLPLPFLDGTFDLIYSIATTFFLTDKLHFLQEVNRVLRPDRIARIHFSHQVEAASPPFEIPPPPYDNLCEIRNPAGRVVSVDSFFASFPFLRFVDQAGGRPRYLELTKLQDTVVFPTRLVEGFYLADFNPKWMPFARSVYTL